MDQEDNSDIDYKILRNHVIWSINNYRSTNIEKIMDLLRDTLNHIDRNRRMEGKE